MNNDLQKKLSSIENCISIQRDFRDGGPYMYGMLNGLILAHAIMCSESPKFEPRPNRYDAKTKIRHKAAR